MNYWQVKAAELERQIRMRELNEAAAQVDAMFAAVMAANGLDPKKRYHLKDADESVTEVTDAKP